MDWMRRNWPDLLIGVALIAVIAGIIATLITGGSFFPLAEWQRPSSSASSSTAPTTSRSSQSEAPTVNVPSSQAGSPDASGTTQSGDRNGGAVAVLPPTSNGAAASSPEGDTSAASSPAPSVQAEDPAAASEQRPASSTTASTTASASTSGPAASPPAGSSASSTGGDAPTAPYRVSVGAFSSEANAERQAQAFRDAGFPVFLGRQGDLVLALVGPFDTLQEAEQAVARIRNGDFGIDPVIYRYRPDDGEEGAAAPSAPGSASASASDDGAAASATADSEPTAPAPAATAGGTRLQVGAYANRESALPQIERLERLGFTVEELQESGLVKLLVGPFEGDGLSEARERLRSEGIEHFPR